MKTVDSKKLPEKSPPHLALCQLGHLMGLFLKELKEKQKGHNTIRNYQNDLACFQYFWIECQLGVFPHNLTQECLQLYQAHLFNKYSAENSRRRRIQTLRIFFDFLNFNQLIKDNIVRSIPSPPKKVDIPAPLPYGQIIKLWNHLKEQSILAKTLNDIEQLIILRNQIIFILIFDAGLKVSDLEHLQVDHLSEDSNKQLRTLVLRDKRDPITIEIDQRHSTNFNRYFKNLRRYKRIYRMSFSHLLFNANPYRILSGGLSPRGIENLFVDFTNTINFKVTPKSLRQSCIFKWLKLKVPQSTIKEWMGVSPRYSLKPYIDLMANFPIDNNFLWHRLAK